MVRSLQNLAQPASRVSRFLLKTAGSSRLSLADGARPRTLTLPGIAVALLVLLAARMGVAQEARPANDAELARSIFNRVVEARSKLVSGRYTATGTWQVGINEDGPIEGPCHMDGAFDQTLEVQQFFKSGLKLLSTPGGKPYGHPVGYLYLQATDRAYFVDGTGGMPNPRDHVSLHVAARDFVPYEFGRPVDMRCLGLNGWASITLGLGLDETIKQLRTLKVTGVSGNSREACTVSLEIAAEAKAAITINPLKGDTVERWEMHVKNKGQAEFARHAGGEIRWEEKGGAWVPVAFKFDLEAEERSSKVDMQITWQLVNDEIPGKLFEPSGLGMSPSTVIVDNNSDQLVTFGRLKDYVPANFPPPASEAAAK